MLVHESKSHESMRVVDTTQRRDHNNHTAGDAQTSSDFARIGSVTNANVPERTDVMNIHDVRFTMSKHAEDEAKEAGLSIADIAQTLAVPVESEPDPRDPTVTRAFRRLPSHGDRVVRVV